MRLFLGRREQGTEVRPCIFGLTPLRCFSKPRAVQGTELVQRRRWPSLISGNSQPGGEDDKWWK